MIPHGFAKGALGQQGAIDFQICPCPVTPATRYTVKLREGSNNESLMGNWFKWTLNVE